MSCRVRVRSPAGMWDQRREGVWHCVTMTGEVLPCEPCCTEQGPYGPKLAPDVDTLGRREIPKGTVAVHGLPGLPELALKGLRVWTREASSPSEPWSPPLQIVTNMTVASEIC